MIPNQSGAHAYIGPWINWSRGAIRGATLTLPQAYAGFLLAFLAIYVTLSGAMFWRLISFILHQINATESGGLRDGLHHQRQVIFRNTGAIGAFWELAKMPVHWRGKTHRPFLRIFAYALLAILTVSGFGVASIFTAEITKVPGNSTIILGDYCGLYIPKSDPSSSHFPIFSMALAQTYDTAAYVRQCYSDNPNSLACGMLPRRRLDFTTNPNATCPFAPGVCRVDDQSAFSMDTGMIDSDLDLGINARPKNRIKFRRVTTCAPVRGARWRRIDNTTYSDPLIYIEAGPALGYNYTFDYWLHSLGNQFGYSLSAVNALASGLPPQWEPVPDLNRTDADVSLMMLNPNDVIFEAPSDDPWIPAHNFTNATDSGGGSFWTSDFYVNLLGCTDQYQICNPNKGGSACTKLSGQNPVLHELVLNTPDLNDHQLWAGVRIMEVASIMNMFYSVHGRGATALNANEKAFSNRQALIPPTQWQTEVKIWFSVCLAKLQFYMIDWAIGPRYTGDATDFITHIPDDAVGKAMCRNQIMRDGGKHQSFSVLGMVVILVVGGILVLLGAFTETIVCWLHIGPEHRRAQWILEDKLQLHRAAHEGFGIGSWERSLKYPTTTDIGHAMPPISDVFPGKSETDEK